MLRVGVLNIFLPIGIPLRSANFPDTVTKQRVYSFCVITIWSPRSLNGSWYLKSAEENSKTYLYNYLSHVQCL